MCLASLLLAPFLCGCKGRTYEIRLVPEGDELRRTVPPDFPKDTPGHCTYARLASSMGTLSAYVERFGAEFNLAEHVSDVREAAVRLSDLLCGWFESELGGEADFENLREFCKEELPADLENLGISLQLAMVLEGADANAVEQPLVWACQYFSERGYFEPEDAPTIVRSGEEPDRILPLVRRRLAQVMGLDEGQPLPGSFDFLSSLDRAEASLAAYLRTTDEFKEQLKQWEEDRRMQPDLHEPSPFDVLSNAAEEVSGFGILFLGFSAADQVHVSLSCPVEPFMTNGRWDGAGGQVEWSRGLGSETVTGSLCYAFWTVSAAEFQVQHFGKVILHGPELAEYVVWRNGLTEEEAGQWDEFVSGLEPGEGLGERIDSFVFPAAPGVALEMRSLLRECLKRGADEGVDAAPTQPEASADHGGATAGVPTPKP